MYQVIKQMYLNMVHNTKTSHFSHGLSGEICAGIVTFWCRTSAEYFIAGDSCNSNNKYDFQDCFIF